MMLDKALFISNVDFLNDSKKEGGVRICSQEYLALISKVYSVLQFPVQYDLNLMYRLRVKIGFNIYNDYKPKKYQNKLIATIKNNKIKVVFLNLSNTSTFSKILKDSFKNSIEVVL